MSAAQTLAEQLELRTRDHRTILDVADIASYRLPDEHANCQMVYSIETYQMKIMMIYSPSKAHRADLFELLAWL